MRQISASVCSPQIVLESTAQIKRSGKYVNAQNAQAYECSDTRSKGRMQEDATTRQLSKPSPYNTQPETLGWRLELTGRSQRLQIMTRRSPADWSPPALPQKLK